MSGADARGHARCLYDLREAARSLLPESSAVLRPSGQGARQEADIRRERAEADRDYHEVFANRVFGLANNFRDRAKRDEEKIARLDDRHQPKTTVRWIFCKAHTYIPDADCPDCVRQDALACSNTTCCGWPCRDHLAIHDETEETCKHR